MPCSMVAAVFIDPYVQLARAVRLPAVTLPPETKQLLVGPAVEEGCHEEDFQAAADFLRIPDPLKVNAYYLWTNGGRRAVLFTGKPLPASTGRSIPPGPAACPVFSWATRPGRHRTRWPSGAPRSPCT